MAKEYTASNPCPVCEGHGGQTRGKGIRCNGFIRDDGMALCKRRLDSGVIDDKQADGPFGVWDISDGTAKPPAFGNTRQASPFQTPRETVAKPAAKVDQVVPFYGDLADDMFPAQSGNRKRVRVDAARQADGGIVAVQVRYVNDQDPSDKLPIPYTPRAGGKWKRGQERTKPIFGLDELMGRPDDPVLVVEGPKARAAAKQMPMFAGYVVVSPFNGCNALNPVIEALRGRGTGIYWWPDADADNKGQDAFAKAANRTEAPYVHLVTLPKKLPDGRDLPDGWDLGDDVPDGLDLVALLEGAQTIEQAAPPPEAGQALSARRWVRPSDLEADDGHVDWLIDGVIEAGSTALLYGPSGHGKTFVTLDLALSVATGTTWAGRAVQQGQVVYVAAEGTKGIGRRFKAWRQHRGQSVTDDAFVVSLGAVRILEAGDVERFIAELREASITPSLIVLDTLAQCLIGGDENNGEAIGRAIDNANHIRRETGAAVLFVHHTGKDVTKGARGHSSLYAAMDTVVAVSRVDPEAKPTETPVKVACDKQKDAEAFAPVYFKLQSVEIGPDQSSLVPDTTTNASIHRGRGESDRVRMTQVDLDIIQAIERAGSNGVSLRELATTTGVSKSTIERHTKILRNSNRIGFIVSTGKLVAATWKMASVELSHCPTSVPDTNGTAKTGRDYADA